MEAIPQAVVARATIRGQEGHLFDAVYDEQFARGLLQFIGSRKRSKLDGGMLVSTRSSSFRRLLDERGTDLGARILRAEQSNSSVLYENRFFLKLFRKLEPGMSPDAEITQFLTEKTGFPYVPPFAGALEFRRDQQEVTVLGLLQGYVPNQEDAWSYALSNVGTYFRRVLEEKPDEHLVRSMPTSFLHVQADGIPAEYYDYLGGFFIEMVALLGQRTGELHRALASSTGDPSFAPEGFTTLYQRSLYQSMRSLARRSLQTLGKGVEGLPEGLQARGREIADSEREILQLLSRIRERKIDGKKIRTHGDYHLGQVLFTGKDFVIIDFEGEPARPISERRLKRSPLRDVAGMIRSFHYAVHTALRSITDSRPEDRAVLEPWAVPWYVHVSGIYYEAYARTVADSGLLPERQEDVELLLQIYLMEKAVYELNYELNNRPDWVAIPIAGIAELLHAAGETEAQST
jgi:maltose alpha-D-glucosyltransferase/alpha-amylase